MMHDVEPRYWAHDPGGKFEVRTMLANGTPQPVTQTTTDREMAA